LNHVSNDGFYYSGHHSHANGGAIYGMEVRDGSVGSVDVDADDEKQQTASMNQRMMLKNFRKMKTDSSSNVHIHRRSMSAPGLEYVDGDVYDQMHHEDGYQDDGYHHQVQQQILLQQQQQQQQQEQEEEEFRLHQQQLLQRKQQRKQHQQQSRTKTKPITSINSTKENKPKQDDTFPPPQISLTTLVFQSILSELTFQRQRRSLQASSSSSSTSDNNNNNNNNNNQTMETTETTHSNQLQKSGDTPSNSSYSTAKLLVDIHTALLLVLFLSVWGVLVSGTTLVSKVVWKVTMGDSAEVGRMIGAGGAGSSTTSAAAAARGVVAVGGAKITEEGRR
jgi:hypothetical protein